MSPLVYQILGGLLVIFHIFLLVMCWKTWRIAHILFSFCAFGAAVTFIIFAALVLKTHASWRSLYVKYDKAVAKADADKERMLFGDPVAVEQKEDSIRTLQAQLTNVVLHRGRIWRGCTLKELVDASTRRVVTAPTNPAPTDKPQANGITPKLILSVFTDVETPEGGKVPGTYLGEFEAKDPTDSEVSLSPTLPLDSDQAARFKADGTTWTLYELVPLDDYEAFSVWDPKENLFVGMEKDELKKYIPKQANWSEERYDKFLDTFHRFNRPALDTDPPENVWVQVKFLKEHEIQVDSDAEQSPLSSDSGYFDASGRAVVRPLRRGEEGKVKFVAGSTGIFDQDTANKLISDGICEKVKQVYRRQLHDYQHFFRELFHRHVELDDAIARATRGATEMVALAAKAKEQQVFHEMEKVKLQLEVATFQKEQSDVTSYYKRLNAEWEAFKQRLSKLYGENLQYADELTRLQIQSAAQINQRAAKAAASTPPTP